VAAVLFRLPHVLVVWSLFCYFTDWEQHRYPVNCFSSALMLPFCEAVYLCRDMPDHSFSADWANIVMKFTILAN